MDIDDIHIRKMLEHIEDQRNENAKRRLLEAEFSRFDCSTLSKMTEAELAKWQAKYPINSPQYIVALQEWNRRALVKQIKAVRWAAFIGLVGVIIGTLLTAAITIFIPKILSSKVADNKISIQQQSAENHSQQNTQKKIDDIKPSKSVFPKP